jgi:hypothetical protein
MKPFEITHWGKMIQVSSLQTNIYELYYDNELVTSITKRLEHGRLCWTSTNLDESETNLLGSIITAKLF